MTVAARLPRRFVKMSGAGNDFVMFLGAPSGGAEEAAALRRLCDRRTGIGADGVLFVRRAGAEIVADYFNADGGASRFCANGTRCAARLAARSLGAGEAFVVRTGWGPVGARVAEDGRVTISLPEAVRPGRTLSTLLTHSFGSGIANEAVEVTVGVPHLVVAVESETVLASLDLSRLGPPLRFHPEMPEGANVDFVARTGQGAISLRTWERGVENETLACGSGTVASAVVVCRAAGEAPPVSARARSGETLVVDFKRAGDVFSEISLEGDARVLFEGEILFEEWP